MNNKLEWGSQDLSSIVAEHRGTCIDFVFTNTMAPSENQMTLIYEGHAAIVDLGIHDKPDMFSVVVAPGWEVVSDNILSIAEGAKGIITACQMLLG